MIRLEADWLHRPATQVVFDALGRGAAQVLLVGGCVRNTLLGEPVGDIDMASDLPPQEVMTRARAAGLRAIPTGIDHGTVTVVSDQIPHEITTFRRDVETDGRRAVVAYSSDVTDDAARRDFTMNALYADRSGQVLDPLGGLDDLHARRVRFIGDAGARIREDYLRSLRYFRFHAWYGDTARGFDPEALDGIASHLDGLAQLSRERVGAEMLKLLAAPDPAPALAGMRQTGVLAQLLPGADDRALAPLVHLENGQNAVPDAVRRLAAVCDEQPAATLRLSRKQLRQLQAMREAATRAQPAAELGWRLGLPAARDALLLRAAFLEQSWPEGTEAALADGANAVFPLSAKDLLPWAQGPALGALLDALQRDWITSGFRLGRDELIARAKQSHSEG